MGAGPPSDRGPAGHCCSKRDTVGLRQPGQRVTQRLQPNFGGGRTFVRELLGGFLARDGTGERDDTQEDEESDPRS